MEPKPARILQPCVETSLQIGQAITCIESVGRLPDGPLKTSITNNLEKYLGALQNEYSTNCLGPHKG
jgi:hypothetical protein